MRQILAVLNKATIILKLIIRKQSFKYSNSGCFIIYLFFPFQISLCCCFLHYISAQHDNQQMTFYPNPVFLQYPESNLQNPINIPYFFTNNDKITETINEKVPLNGINNFRINTRRFDSPVEMPYRVHYEEERPRNAR